VSAAFSVLGAGGFTSFVSSLLIGVVKPGSCRSGATGSGLERKIKKEINKESTKSD
jgi:hypothetical protein